jgi:hypothetical protein
MNQKIAVMGLAMMTFSSQVMCAKAMSQEGFEGAYASWGSSYVPHYGADGWLHPMMDHLSVPEGLPQRNKSDAWRLELAPPATASDSSDNPLMAKDKRVGVTFKHDF